MSESSIVDAIATIFSANEEELAFECGNREEVEDNGEEEEEFDFPQRPAAEDVEYTLMSRFRSAMKQIWLRMPEHRRTIANLREEAISYVDFTIEKGESTIFT